MALKISYSDDLKIPHQFVDTNETVSFQPLSQSGGRDRGGGGVGGFGSILTGGQRGGSGNNIYGIIIIGAIVVSAIAIDCFVYYPEKIKIKAQ